MEQASVASKLLNTRRTKGVPQRQQKVISRRMQSAPNCNQARNSDTRSACRVCGTAPRSTADSWAPEK